MRIMGCFWGWLGEFILVLRGRREFSCGGRGNERAVECFGGKGREVEVSGDLRGPSAALRMTDWLAGGEVRVVDVRAGL
jgi:hypothetical protein